MVFGFGKKEIEVTLDGYNYSPGETIKGKATVNLKNPVEARQLKVVLLGKSTTTRIGGDMNRGTQTFEYFQMPLDGEKTYTRGEYRFEIKIPADILRPTPKGILGEASKAIQLLSGGYTRISWYIQAVLDRPGKPDISSKKVQINIG